MANWRTSADLLDGVLERCGELTDGTSSYEDVALKYLNSVYRAILAGGNEFGTDCGEPWIWAQASSPQLLTLKAPVTTGTIALTNGLAAGTFSSAPAASLLGWYIKLDAGKDWYQISAHTGASTSFTLDNVFLEESASGTFRAIKTDYLLGTAVTRLVAPMVCFRDNLGVVGAAERGQIYEIDLNTMIRKYPRMLIQQSMPDKYAVIGQSTSDALTVRFNSYPAEDSRIEIPYIPVAADLTDSGSSVPLIPLGFREFLLHGAAYYVMLDKSDNRADAEAMLAKAKLQALVAHNRKSLSLAGGNFGRLVPRASGTVRARGANVS